MLLVIMAWIVNKYILKLYSPSLSIVINPMLTLIPSFYLFYFLENLNLNFFVGLFIKLLIVVILSLWLFRLEVGRLIRNP